MPAEDADDKGLRVYLLERGELTLADVLARDLITTPRAYTLPTSDISVRLPATQPGKIHLGNRRQLPATDHNLSVLAERVGMPPAFLRRLDNRPHLQEEFLGALLGDEEPDVDVLVSEHQIDAVVDAGRRVVLPTELFQIAYDLLGPDAEVLKFVATASVFWLDAVVPATSDRAVGGDRSVGDISRGGLRLFHDRQHNLAPQACELIERLVCTNGLEVVTPGDKIDARGQTADAILKEINAVAEAIMGRVERTIAAFYGLRAEIVEHPAERVAQLAKVYGLSSARQGELARRVSEFRDPETGNVTRFDMVNLITNEANSPKVKTGPARLLQQLAGHEVHAHETVCKVCQQVVP